MSENKRFIIDDAGSLIDIETHTCYEYVDELVYVLNQLNNENEELKIDKDALLEENKELKNKLEPFLNLCDDYNLTLDQAYEICEQAIEKEGGIQ